MAGGGATSEALAERGALLEEHVRGWCGGVPEDLADGGFERVEELIGLLAPFVGIGPASAGVNGRRVVGPVDIFICVIFSV